MEAVYIIGAILTFVPMLRKGIIAALITAALWPLAWVLGLLIMIYVAVVGLQQKS